MSYSRDEEGCFALIFGGAIFIAVAYIFGNWLNSRLQTFGIEFSHAWVATMTGAILLIGSFLMIVNFKFIMRELIYYLDCLINRKHIKNLEYQYEQEIDKQKSNLKNYK